MTRLSAKQAAAHDSGRGLSSHKPEARTMEKQLTEACPKTVADLVGYQPGAVVSRQLLKQDNGNVTLFAFDTGEGLTEHTSPFAARVQIVDGDAEVTVGGKSHLVHTGEVILLPAGVSHALVAPHRFKMLLTMIEADIVVWHARSPEYSSTHADAASPQEISDRQQAWGQQTDPIGAGGAWCKLKLKTRRTHHGQAPHHQNRAIRYSPAPLCSRYPRTVTACI